MSHDKKDREGIIPVDLIRETVMPPYEYQKSQHGFGSVSTPPADTTTVPKKSSTKIDKK